MVNYSKFEAIVQAEVEESHETTQHVLTLLDHMILLPPREEFPVPSSRASTTRHPPLDWPSFIRFQMEIQLGSIYPKDTPSFVMPWH